MDFELNTEQTLLKNTVIEFAQNEIEPVALAFLFGFKYEVS